MAQGLAREGFDLDLAYGEARETAFTHALLDCHVECKSQQKTRVTGNVAIEIRQGSPKPGHGRESGIAVTTAKWWALEYEDDCWLVIRTSLLKAKVDAAIRMGRVRMCGDGNRYENVLVPIDWLVRGWRPVAE